jgi:hypothetical protein
MYNVNAIVCLSRARYVQDVCIFIQFAARVAPRYDSPALLQGY